jgi:peptidoglycan/xylan/chitin deacetylase (PgdA/CDA1 family)
MSMMNGTPSNDEYEVRTADQEAPPQVLPVKETSAAAPAAHGHMSMRKRMILVAVVVVLTVGIALAIALPLTMRGKNANEERLSGASISPPKTYVPLTAAQLSLHTQCVIPGTVAITFDDGPSAYTEHILDALKLFHYPATFFMVGSVIPGHENALHRMMSEGHTPASHTFTHANLSSLSVSQIQDEMKKTALAISTVIGKDPIFMRPPYLEINDLVQETLNDMGYVPITINWDTKDYENPNPPAAGTVHPSINVWNQIASSPTRMSDSVVILMHDVVQSTSTQIEQILSIVQQSGIKPVTMEDCLGIPYAYRS